MLSFTRIMIQNAFWIMKITDSTFIKQVHFFSIQYKNEERLDSLFQLH